jgi:hypothetical protein
MNQLQTVLEALEQRTDETPRCDLGALDAKIHEAISIVKQMMQAEPVTHQFYGSDFEWCNFDNDVHYRNTVEDRGWVIRALYTHPTPQAAPAGFVLVPVEPTTKMLDAMTSVWLVGATSDMALREYKAMLAAAPAGAV